MPSALGNHPFGQLICVMKTRNLKLVERSDVISISSFLGDLIKLKRWLKPNLWFRGQSRSSYKLKPSCARPYHYASNTVKMFPPDRERELLDRFSRNAFLQLGRISGEWEAMFVARHYGLPVRMMDWTANPLAGLYFACRAQKDGDDNSDGLLWALAHLPSKHELKIFQLMRQSKKRDGPFDRYRDKKNGKIRLAVKLVPPLMNSPRIIAQNGVFTYHSKPDVALEDCVRKQFDEDCLDFSHLVKWRVPRSRKAQLLKELHIAGVSRRVLFPDLDGIAQGAWEAEVLFMESEHKEKS
jgi:hypothetical protein